MFAKNAKLRSWFDDVKVVFFGPSEKLVVQDEDVKKQVKEISTAAESFACKAISDREGISKEIEAIGPAVIYVGSKITSLINDGYIPMVW